ncbi:MAG: acyl-CoA dehydrogenase family protein [Thermodesulfobacteriota bacterium]|nr:acyl-CoA dehydrogenase family protein [Thermodesulfobacteriota bacterium]
MANFYTDNEDIQFHLEDTRLRRITELREKGYAESEVYPFAPESFEDAKDNFHRVLSLVGEICADTLAPAASHVDREGCRLADNRVTYAQGTQEALKRFAQADLLGFTLPRQYGGLNLPITIYMMAIEIVSRADASFMNLFGLQEIAETICQFGSEELKEKYLPKFASGQYTGAMVLTEPEAGSDLQAISLRAAYDEKEKCWHLNGVKHFITNGCGDVLLVLARSEVNLSGGRGLSLFLYEKDENLLVRRLEDKLGIHGSPTCELQFRNCPAHLIGQRKRGLTRYVMPLMNGARLAVGAQSVGIAQEAYYQALAYAKQRKQFGQAIIEFPPVFQMLSTMRVRIEAARSLLYEASIMVDLQQAMDRNGTREKVSAKELGEVKRFVSLLTPMVKYYASEMCNKIAYDAIQVFGGAGYMRDFPIERLYRDARITTIYEGTSQLQIIGAIAGVMSGLFFRMLANRWERGPSVKLTALEGKIADCEKWLERAIICVKAQDNHRCTEYHARGLVDMAVETMTARLLMEHGARSSHKLDVAKRFVADAYPRIEMLAERAMTEDIHSIHECRGLLGRPDSH